MPYARRFNYQGIYPLWRNTIDILKRDLAAEIDLIEAETGATIPDIDPANIIGADRPDPPDSWIVVQPDLVDVAESESGLTVDEENTLDILIACKVTDSTTLEELTTRLIRYERAVRNVLLSATSDTEGSGPSARIGLLTGVTHFPGEWNVRRGSYGWATIGQVKVRVVAGMKLIFTYEEVRNL